jgi:hypothetical protein
MDTKYKVRTTCFHFNSHVGVFVGDRAYSWVKDFRYIYCDMIINSTSLYSNNTCVREDNG